jgi:D-sedoheptulose 7-phosphate isomerase
MAHIKVDPAERKSQTAIRFLDEFTTLSGMAISSDSKSIPCALEAGFAKVIEAIECCAANNHQLIFIGNGGSAAVASHQAVDYWKNGGIKAISFNDTSLLTCIANDFGYEKVFVEPLKRFASAGDMLIAISSSGKSQNILQAVGVARSIGCGVMTLSGFDKDNPLRSLGDVNFYIPSNSYGLVEIAHLTLLHAMLESVMCHQTKMKSRGVL